MVNLERLIQKVEERDRDYLIVYQATEGEHNSNPCVKVRFMYNSSPCALIGTGNQRQRIKRDTD